MEWKQLPIFTLFFIFIKGPPAAGRGRRGRARSRRAAFCFIHNNQKSKIVLSP